MLGSAVTIKVLPVPEGFVADVDRALERARMLFHMGTVKVMSTPALLR
jgi:hypothetical protein